MKKFIALFIALTMCFAMSTNIVAETPDEQRNILVDTNVEVITSASLNQLVETNQELSSTLQTRSTSPQIEISYSYDFNKLEENPSVAGVEFYLLLNIENIIVPICLVGDVQSYTLSTGQTLWHGPIFGNTIINDSPFKAIVGFSKIEQASEVKATLTLQSLDEKYPINPITLTFGEELPVDESASQVQIVAESSSKRNLSTTNSNLIQSISTSDPLTDDFSYLTFQYGQFLYIDEPDEELNLGLGQRARAYFSSGTNRFALTFKSYCSKVDTYYSLQNKTSVYRLKYTLERDPNMTAANNSYIAGTESFSFDTTNYGGAIAVLLLPLFQDMMSILGIPTSVISQALQNLVGRVSRSIYTDETTVCIEFGLTAYANFDDTDAGIPIVFQLASSNASQYVGNSSYTFTTSVLYITSLDTFEYSYIFVSDASKSVQFSLTV